MNAQLEQLYYRHIGFAFDRQLSFADFLDSEVPGLPFSYVISAGTLTFGESLEFKAVDLGSHADPDDSWLWSWCNRSLNLPPSGSQLRESVQHIGTAHDIDIFKADRQFSCQQHLGNELAPFTAHIFAAIIAGELGFDAYYTVPFTHGRSVVLLRDERLRTPPPNATARIAMVFPQLISALSIFDQRAAFIGYVQRYGFGVQQPAESVRAVCGSQVVTAQFDSQSRLVEISAIVQAETTDV